MNRVQPVAAVLAIAIGVLEVAVTAVLGSGTRPVPGAAVDRGRSIDLTATVPDTGAPIPSADGMRIPVAWADGQGSGDRDPIVPLGSAATVAAQSPRWSVDDVLLQESVTDVAVSPDGRWAVWVRAQMNAETGRRQANLWLSRLDDGRSWPITRGSDVATQPRWSPDGGTVAFVFTRSSAGERTDAEGPQLWLWRRDGGEPWPLTRGLRGLRSFAWKGNDTIVFQAREAPARWERLRRERRDEGYAVEDTAETPPVRLWAVDVRGGEPRRLSEAPRSIESFLLAPDGRWALVRTTTSLSYEFDQRQPPRVERLDLATGAFSPVPGWPDRLVPEEWVWTRDGRHVAVLFDSSSHPIYRTASVRRLGVYEPGTGAFRFVNLRWPREASGALRAVPGGVALRLADGVRDRLARVLRRGDAWERRWWEGPHQGQMWGAWDVSADGRRVVYVRSTATEPPQLFVAEARGDRLDRPRQLDTLNRTFAAKPKLRAEIARYVGALGDTVEGVLYYPLGYRPGRRYPLIVSIHGGPASADRDAWSASWAYPLPLWVQRGAFVLKPNYHGSSSYGLAWVESIGAGRYYDLEVVDLVAGVRALIDRGLVHPDSVAAQGWSNGAILTTALTVEHPTLLRAAVAGAGNVEWISDWGNVDFGAAFDNYYLGASPLEDPQRYIAKSPFFRLDRVRTPTLIFFGTEDRNVPPSQGWSHFRALQQLGRVPVRFVLFPGEPHSLGRLAHQRRKVEEELRWLERYLWGRPDTANPALDPRAPLAGLLARAGAARDDGLYGVRWGDALVPEVVAGEGVALGRFEVTRAQWHAFDPRTPVPPGTENLPITGITYAQAQAYVAWLRQRTGQPFRLPHAEELDRWAARAGAGNTLDAWLGYDPNPEDLARLRPLLERLPGPAPLLRPVGETLTDVADGVFDLRGNAAEWVEGGHAWGRSAERAGASPSPPAPAYTGFRVARDRP